MIAQVRKEILAHKWVFALSLLFIAINAVFMAANLYWFLFLPLALFAVLLALSSLDKFVLFIVFVTPVSVPLEYYKTNLGFNLQLVSEPLLILALFLFFFRLIKERSFDRRLLTHPISWVIYFQLVWMLITSITSTMPLVSFKFLISRLWFLVSFYFLASSMFEKKKMIRQYLWMYLPAMVFVIAYAIIHLVSLGLFNQKGAHLAASPFFKDHTSYGAVLAMLIPAVIALGSIKYYKVPVRILIWMIVAILVIAIIYSYTRAAWISIFAITVLFIVIKLRISIRLLSIFAVFIGLVLFAYRTEIFLKMEQNRQDSSKDLAKHIESISNIRTDASNLERINRWHSAFRMFHEKPLVGWGPGTYMFKYAPFQVTYEKTIISTNAGDWGNAHSEYIGPLAEMGLPGMMGMVFLIIITLHTAYRVYHKAEEHSQIRVLSLGITLGLITYYIHGGMNNFLDTDKASALFWGFTAMLVAMDVYHTRTKKLTE